MFDAHCHLDFDAFEDRQAVIARARAVGVEGIHVPGVCPEQWPRAAALCTEEIRHGVGIHPWWVNQIDDLDAALDQLKSVAERTGAEAIGECGLDAPRAKRGGASLDLQQRVFEAHLDVAAALSLPVVLHVVGAHGRALALLQERGPLPAGGMVHSYSGSAEMVDGYAALGLFFSFGAAVTREHAKRARSAVCAAPADRLLLESDGPDQPLEGRELGEPEDVAVTCGVVAELRGEPVATVAARTAENARRLFGR